MNKMNPIIKAILIAWAIMLPITLVVNLTQPSRGVVAVVTTVGMSVCALIAAKLYVDWKAEDWKAEQRAKLD